MGLDMYFEARHTLSSKRKKDRELIAVLNSFPFSDNEKKELFGEDEYSSGVYCSEWTNPELYNLIKDVKLYGQQGQIKIIRAKRGKTGHIRWEVETESFYWRKENAIHKWFVDNVQNGVDDCGEYQVSYQHMQDLVAAMDMVLKDKTLADTVLPSQSGFFFGGTEYDNWYYDGLKRTRKAFKRMLNSISFNKHWVPFYHSSW